MILFPICIPLKESLILIMWHKISSQIWFLFCVKCIIILSANYPLNNRCIYHDNLQKASITKCRASAFKLIYTIIYIIFLMQYKIRNINFVSVSLHIPVIILSEKTRISYTSSTHALCSPYSLREISPVYECHSQEHTS